MGAEHVGVWGGSMHVSCGHECAEVNVQGGAVQPELEESWAALRVSVKRPHRHLGV